MCLWIRDTFYCACPSSCLLCDIERATPCPDVLLTKQRFLIILLFYPTNHHSQEVPLHSLAKLTEAVSLCTVYSDLQLESLFYDLPQSNCICFGPDSSKGGIKMFAVCPITILLLEGSLPRVHPRPLHTPLKEPTMEPCAIDGFPRALNSIQDRTLISLGISLAVSRS